MPRKKRAIIESDEEIEEQHTKQRPSRKDKKGGHVDVDMSDESDDPEQPGPSTRISKKTKRELSASRNRRLEREQDQSDEAELGPDFVEPLAEVEKVEETTIKRLAQYLLMSCAKRGYAKEEEARRIIGGYLKYTKSDVRDRCFNCADKLLQDALGVKIIHEPKTKRYFLHNEFSFHNDALEKEELELQKLDDGFEEVDDAKKGMLTILLTYIFMTKQDTSADQGVTNDALSYFVNEISKEDDTIVPKKLEHNGEWMQEYCQQGWISTRKHSDLQGNEEIFFDWGVRSLKSVDPAKCLKQYCEITQQNIDDFPEKKQFALKLRGENGFTDEAFPKPVEKQTQRRTQDSQVNRSLLNKLKRPRHMSRDST